MKNVTLQLKHYEGLVRNGKTSMRVYPNQGKFALGDKIVVKCAEWLGGAKNNGILCQVRGHYETPGLPDVVKLAAIIINEENCNRRKAVEATKAKRV